MEAGRQQRNAEGGMAVDLLKWCGRECISANWLDLGATEISGSLIEDLIGAAGNNKTAANLLPPESACDAVPVA